MSWLGLKAKLIGLGALLLTVLGFFVRLKVVKHQRDKFEHQAKTFKAKAVQEKKINTLDGEVHSDLARVKQEAKKSIEKGEVPEHLEKPNDW
jgi:hypothetical protein